MTLYAALFTRRFSRQAIRALLSAPHRAPRTALSAPCYPRLAFCAAHPAPHSSGRDLRAALLTPRFSRRALHAALFVPRSSRHDLRIALFVPCSPSGHLGAALSLPRSSRRALRTTVSASRSSSQLPLRCGELDAPSLSASRFPHRAVFGCIVQL